MRKSRFILVFSLLILALLASGCARAAQEIPGPTLKSPTQVVIASPTSSFVTQPPAPGAENPAGPAQTAPIPTPTQAEIASPTPFSQNLTPLLNGAPSFSHVFIIVLENKEARQILDNPDAPYLNQLAQEYARAEDFYAITHPSLPNYLALIGGDTFGISSDCNTCYVDADNLASQLAAAGRTWKAYMESMPEPCYARDALPEYSVTHNPFLYFNAIRKDPDQCSRVVPFTQFSTDLQAGDLPDFVWITPNTCNDMHNCSIQTGDAWLQTWTPEILASSAWQNDGVLFITFDEGVSQSGCCSFAAGGKIFTLVISPLVKAGFVSTTSYDHYSLLRTIETAWDLPLLGKAASNSTPLMSEFFAR